jgi:hypothetical protein
VSLQLVDAVCGHDNYSSVRDDLLQWMTGVLDHLGQLPLAVRLFAEWLHQELLQAAHDKATVDVADLRSRWDREYADEADDCAGVLGSVIGSRGLRATVRLALGILKAHGDYEPCRQLLGLLALCPPVEVPWSLFDGGINGEGSQLLRGTRVEFSRECLSLEFVSSVGERCRVTRLKSGKLAPKPRHATVANDHVTDGKICIEYDEGDVVSIPVVDLEFGLHIRSVQCDGGRCVLQLQKPVFAKGAEFIISNHVDKRLNGRKVSINHHYIIPDPKSDAADNRNVSITFVDTKEESLLHLKYLQLPDSVAIIDNQLVYQAQPLPPSPPPSTTGRVVKYHRADSLKHDPASDTVSVAFGCESGAFLVHGRCLHLLCVTLE